MGKKRTRANKSQKQSTHYKKIVKSLQGYQSTDDNENFAALQGSTDEFIPDNNVQKDSAVTGVKRQKAKQFLIEHWFETLVSFILAAVVAVAGWMISSLISLKEDIAVCSYRVERMEEDIKDIKTDDITREFLEKELQILKLEIENANAKDITNLELRISLLENQIANLQGKNG